MQRLAQNTQNGINSVLRSALKMRHSIPTRSSLRTVSALCTSFNTVKRHPSTSGGIASVRIYGREMTTVIPPSDTPTSQNIFDLAAILKAEEIDTLDRIDAINSIQIIAETKAEEASQVLQVIDSNVLEILLGFLQDNDTIAASDLLVPSFLALIRLSPLSLIAQELLRLNAVEILIPFLRQSDPRLQAAASLTLGNLALDVTSTSVINTPEVVDAVFHVLSSPHEAIQRAAVTCLGNIAGNSKGRERICATEGGIHALCERLSADHVDQLRSASAFALGNVLAGHHSDTQDMLRECGGLAELVMLLSPAFPEEVISSAAWAIHHGIYSNRENQTLIGEAGGLGLLTQSLAASTETLQTNAILALESAVVSHAKNREWCQEHGVRGALQRIQADEGDDLNANAKIALSSLLEELE